MQSTMVSIGPGVFIGAYRVLHQIGEGGMGSVWMAEHTKLGRRAAIKVLHPAFSNQPEIVQRFFNEARAATAITDPGIVQIFDFGHHVDGSAYIVMELLDGEPLDKRLSRQGGISIQDSFRIMRQVASTLGAEHQRGIVHRDLKPENIYLVRDPEVPGGERAKILDFGIAKLQGDANGVKTQTSAVMGTPTYMSPEQCRGAGTVDQRSDVYALGCVLFTLVTGRPPFVGEGVGDLISMHMREPPPLPSTFAHNIPPALEALIMKCLQKDPNARYASGADLASAIGLLTGSSPSLSGMVPSVAGGPAHTTLSAAVASSTQPGTTPGSKRGMFIGLSAGVVVIAIIAIVAVTKKSDTQTSEKEEPAAASAPTAPAAPVVTQPAAPAAPTPPADKPEVVAMRSALKAFARWAPGHAGAACPSAADLNLEADPWNHPYVVTCTDQPADQMIGITSSGPDGASGTADDIHSWTLSADDTAPIRGARWVVKPTADVATKTTPTAPVAKTQTKASTHHETKHTGSKDADRMQDLDGDGIPDTR